MFQPILWRRHHHARQLRQLLVCLHIPYVLHVLGWQVGKVCLCAGCFALCTSIRPINQYTNHLMEYSNNLLTL